MSFYFIYDVRMKNVQRSGQRVDYTLKRLFLIICYYVVSLTCWWSPVCCVFQFQHSIWRKVIQLSNLSLAYFAILWWTFLACTFFHISAFDIDFNYFFLYISFFLSNEILKRQGWFRKLPHHLCSLADSHLSLLNYITSETYWQMPVALFLFQAHYHPPAILGFWWQGGERNRLWLGSQRDLS